MPLITLFAGDYCQAESVASRICERTGCGRLDDAALIDRIHAEYGTARSKLAKVFSADDPGFNKFTHEKGLAIARLKHGLARSLMGADNLLIHGFVGQLVPKSMANVLRVCLVADTAFRAAASASDRGISAQAAKQLIHLRDDDCAAWLQRFHAVDDPWDPSLYDLVIATDTTAQETAVDLVLDALAQKAGLSRDGDTAAEDFLLATQVEVAMFSAGHQVQVSARNGEVTLMINRSVLLLEQLERELAEIVKTVPGVESMRIREKSEES